jgi:RNA polymerase sigma-70 factor (ECF subfamily)
LRDEQKLVHRAQQGDKNEALAEIYEAYFDKIYRYVMVRMGNRVEAEDVTQEAFLKAARSIHSFRWKGVPFSAWLFRIARNEVIDSLRKKSRQPTVLLNDLPVVPASNAGNPHPAAELELDIEQLRAATRQLTQAQQEVISLRFSAELRRVIYCGGGKSHGQESRSGESTSTQRDPCPAPNTIKGRG